MPTINNTPLYIQYGCGLSAPEKWLNFDASPTLRLQRLPIIGPKFSKRVKFPDNVEYGDIVKGLPLKDFSVDGAYCSHILEHLSLEDFVTALNETHRILKTGGIFRLVLPDLEVETRNYLRDKSSKASLSFMRKSHLGIEKRSNGLKPFIRDWIGNSKHLWMWDYKTIEPFLINAGFSKVRRAEYNDTDNSMFKLVEEKGRWLNCLGVEAIK